MYYSLLIILQFGAKELFAEQEEEKDGTTERRNDGTGCCTLGTLMRQTTCFFEQTYVTYVAF